MGAMVACCTSCFVSKQDPYSNEHLPLVAQGPFHEFNPQTSIALKEIIREKKTIADEKQDLARQMRETKDQFHIRLTDDLTTYISTSHPEILFKETDAGVIFHTSFPLPVPAKQVVAVLQDFESRKKWDTSLILTELVSQVDDVRVVYMQFHSSLSHAGRDLLTAVQTYTETDGTRLIVSRSIVSPAYPLKVNVIRSNVTMSGFRIRQRTERESNIDYVLEVQVGKRILRADTIETQMDSLRGFVKALSEYLLTLPT